MKNVKPKQGLSLPVAPQFTTRSWPGTGKASTLTVSGNEKSRERRQKRRSARSDPKSSAVQRRRRHRSGMFLTGGRGERGCLSTNVSTRRRGREKLLERWRSTISRRRPFASARFRFVRCCGCCGCGCGCRLWLLLLTRGPDFHARCRGFRWLLATSESRFKLFRLIGTNLCMAFQTIKHPYMTV